MRCKRNHVGYGSVDSRLGPSGGLGKYEESALAIGDVQPSVLELRVVRPAGRIHRGDLGQLDPAVSATRSRQRQSDKGKNSSHRGILPEPSADLRRLRTSAGAATKLWTLSTLANAKAGAGFCRPKGPLGTFAHG